MHQTPIKKLSATKKKTFSAAMQKKDNSSPKKKSSHQPQIPERDMKIKFTDFIFSSDYFLIFLLVFGTGIFLSIKRITFLLSCTLFLVMNLVANAQVKDLYTFSQGMGSYLDSTISGGTPFIITGNGLGSFDNNDIGFTFTFNAVNYTKFSVSPFGFIALGFSVKYSSTAISSGITNNVIAAFNTNLGIRSLSGFSISDLQYKTITDPNNAAKKICVIQWTKFQKGGNNADSYDFQIRLKEDGNVVQIMYGTMVNGANEGAVQVGLRGVNTNDYNNRTTITDWSDTDPGTVNSATCKVSATSTTLVPPSGLTFTWTPITKPFVYAACTTIQPDTSDVLWNSVNNPVIAVKVMISGNSGAPFNLTAIKIKDSSTNYTRDVTKVKVFYTGISSVFDTTTLFGWSKDITTPIEGNVMLYGGTNANYFWVTYDIAEHPKADDTLDAKCLSLTLSGTDEKIPDITDPAGQRMIAQWVQKASINGARAYAAGFSIGKKGYAGLGFNGASAYFTDFYEYDSSIDEWTQLADFPGTGRYGCVSFSIGKKGYVMTGGNFSIQMKDVWEYDVETDIWTQKEPLPGGVRTGAAGFSIGGKGYIIGGSSTTALKDVWEYDPENDTWLQKSDFPGTARISAIEFSIGGKGYYGGGALKDFWEYDPGNDTWTEKANIINVIYGSVCFTIGSKGYVVIGDTQKDQCWVYDANSDTWVPHKKFTGGKRYAAVGFFIDSIGAFLGMGYDGPKSDFWQYYRTGDAPSSAFSVEDTIVCSNDFLTFTAQSNGSEDIWNWSFTGGTPSSSTLRSPTVTYATAGTYDVTLSVSNDNGESTTTQQQYITVLQSPEVDAGIDATICPPDTGTTLFASGNGVTSYRWSPSYGLSCTDCQQPYAYPDSTTIYIVRVTGEGGCDAIDTVVVNVSSIVIADAGPNVSLCEGGKVQLHASGGTNYTWSPTTGLDSASIAEPMASPTVTTKYYVTVSSGSCTPATDSVTVTVHKNPDIPTITQNGNILTSSSSVRYQWFRNGDTISGATLQAYTVTQYGYYTVVVTDSNGCSSTSARIQVTVGIEPQVEKPKNSFVLFPNPNTGMFTFSFDADQINNYDIEVRDVLGRVVYEEHLVKFVGHYSEQFDLSRYPKGFYSLLVRSGTQRMVVKVLKY